MPLQSDPCVSHSSVALCFQASTPYSLESESLRMDCIMSGGASPTLAIGAANNKVRHTQKVRRDLILLVQEEAD